MAKFSEIEILSTKVKFRTEFKDNQAFTKINLNKEVLFLGSCFAENIGQQLLGLKIKGNINPLGIAYNPFSIAEMLDLQAETLKPFDQEKKGMYFNYLLHSKFNHLDEETYKNNILNQLEKQKQSIKNSTYIFVSLGTAWVYRLKSNGKVINNCHKQEASLFDKTLLSIEECKEALNKIANQFKKSNVIFTVSPIRHLKDGFRENTLSKSVLHLAANDICNKYSHVSYFPSYELLLDDLRDYRFYDMDLLHPNKQGIKYIWDYFLKSFFSETDQNELKKREKLLQSVHHKAFHTESSEHQEFLKQLKQKLENQSELFEDEIKIIERKLVSQ